MWRGQLAVRNDAAWPFLSERLQQIVFEIARALADWPGGTREPTLPFQQRGLSPLQNVSPSRRSDSTIGAPPARVVPTLPPDAALLDPPDI
jgi:hypothetical protein